jgi:ribosomal protein S6--L-glutamate ligase
MKKVRIGFLLPRYSRRSKSYMPAVVQILADADVIVDVIHPVEHMVDLAKLRVEHDLYVLRKTSGFALSLAGALHELGAAIVNPYPVSAALHDKIITVPILQAAGVPTPATYVAEHPQELAPLLDAGPIVIKPYQGAGGHHVRVVHSAAELGEVPDERREPVFAQRYHPPQGRDRKIYVIGDELFGIKKIFPRRTEEDKLGEPFTPTSELRDIVLNCGRAFGIDLYGVDIIESDRKPYVVDMCSIPGFKGVPDAPQLLARYFRAAAERAARGERPLRGATAELGVPLS